MGPKCSECNRGSRYPQPLHLLLHRWDSHHVFRLMWMLLVSEPFAESLEQLGHPVPTKPVELEEVLQHPLEEGASIPPFYRVDFHKILPNRFERFCPACNISYLTDSSYIRLPLQRTQASSNEAEHLAAQQEAAARVAAEQNNGEGSESSEPSSGVELAREAMLFDTDLPDLEPIFSVGRQMVAVTEPIVRLFDTTPEVEIKEVPIQANPLGNIQRPETTTDW